MGQGRPALPRAPGRARAGAIITGANLEEVADAWVAAGPQAKQSYLAAFDTTTSLTEALFFGAFMAMGLYLAALATAILTRRLPPVDRLDLRRQCRSRALGRPARARFRVGFHRRPRGLCALQGGSDRPRRLDVATSGGATAARHRERASRRPPVVSDVVRWFVLPWVVAAVTGVALVALLRSGRRGSRRRHPLGRTAGALLVAGFAVFIPGAAFAVSSETGTDHIPPTFSTRAARSCCLPRYRSRSWVCSSSMRSCGGGATDPCRPLAPPPIWRA